MSGFDTIPYRPGIKLIHFRIWWIIFATMLFPSVLAKLGMPVPWMLFCVGILALPACISDLKTLGVKSISLQDVMITVLITVLILILSGIASKFWRFQLEHFGFKFHDKQDIAETISGGKSWLDLLLLYVSVCIITPIIEEVLFRRLIYSVFRKYDATAAFFVTSAIFSVIHFFIPGIAGLFILGCGFQFIFLYRKNLACAMIAHSMVNTVAFFANRA